MFVDYHTHHNRCGHAVGSIEDYIIRGLEIGLHQLGVADHLPLFHLPPSAQHSGLAMAREELPRYVEEVLRLKEKYRGDLEIRLGIEADFVEGYEEELEKLLEGIPWDYVIGSVHYLGDWDLFDSRQLGRWQEQEPAEVYRAYYRAVRLAAESGFFDIIGHFDGIKRYGRASVEEEHDLQLEALEAAARNGVAVELNTAGLRHAAASAYPSPPVLAYCKKVGIPVTIGSDAHHPRQLGAGYEEAVRLMTAAGIHRVALFSGRRLESGPLSVLDGLTEASM